MSYIIAKEQDLEQTIEKVIRKVLGTPPATIIQPEEDELLNIEQAAKFLSLAIPTVYGLVHRMAIPYCKPTGRRLYFSKKELTKWVKTGRAKTMFEIQNEAENYIQAKRRGGRA
jgi:excisionase family DNA binding protein